jgi:hypothetical protein
VTASPRALGALFTGFSDPIDLARAGLLSGVDLATAAFLRGAFATPPPSTPEHY